MRFHLRSAACLLIAIVMAALPVHAQTLADEAYVSAAPQAILIDAKSGRVFYEKDADKAVQPGNMSKLMTQTVVLDLLKSGELLPDTKFTVSTNAWKKGGAPSKGTTMYAKAKTQISVADLLRGAIVASGNDACLVLAEGIDGKESAFVNRMNIKAEEIGLKTSRFRNATGNSDPSHVMSVRDLATLARYVILNHPDYFSLYSEKEFTWSEIKQPNRNPLLVDYPGSDGMMTGFTKEGGYGIVGTVERDGRRLIMVLAGMKSLDDRKAEAEKILDWGLARFRAVEVYAEGDRVGRARVWGGKDHWVDLVTKTSFSVALTKEERKTAEIKLAYRGPLIAPVRAGDQVGIVKVFIEGRAVAELPVMTAASVESVESMWQKALDSALIMAFGG